MDNPMDNPFNVPDPTGLPGCGGGERVWELEGENE